MDGSNRGNPSKSKSSNADAVYKLSQELAAMGTDGISRQMHQEYLQNLEDKINLKKMRIRANEDWKRMEAEKFQRRKVKSEEQHLIYQSQMKRIDDGLEQYNAELSKLNAEYERNSVEAQELARLRAECAEKNLDFTVESIRYYCEDRKINSRM